MPHPDQPSPQNLDRDPVELALTWTVTVTYTGRVTLAEIAEATGRHVQGLTRDPWSLRGAAEPALADLLTAPKHDAQRVGRAEIEITDVEVVAPSRLVDLVAAADAALRAEADQPTPAGHALAALLAGLRREEVIDA
jgi:hypothetical protein